MNDFNVLIIGSDSLIAKQLWKTMADNGIFHLSGDRAVSYYEFAKKMVEVGILPNTLIHSMNCSKNDFRDGYLDTPILSLTEISRRAGIHLEYLDDMLLTLKKRMDKND